MLFQIMESLYMTIARVQRRLRHYLSAGTRKIRSKPRRRPIISREYHTYTSIIIQLLLRDHIPRFHVFMKRSLPKLS